MEIKERAILTKRVEEICSGHLSQKTPLPPEIDKEPHCWKCERDDHNEQCPYYNPIK